MTIVASIASSHSYCTTKTLFKEEFLQYISCVIWLVPPTTPLHPTPTLALLSWGESISVATTAPVHKRPALPWARVEVPEQNIFRTGPLRHRLQAAVCRWNCMWGEKEVQIKRLKVLKKIFQYVWGALHYSFTLWKQICIDTTWGH